MVVGDCGRPKWGQFRCPTLARATRRFPAFFSAKSPFLLGFERSRLGFGRGCHRRALICREEDLGVYPRPYGPGRPNGAYRLDHTDFVSLQNDVVQELLVN